MENAWKDIRFAARRLRRSPGFTVVAALSLALGIGANTAVYSVIDSALVRQLPVREPDRLVLVNWVAASSPRGSHNGWITRTPEGNRTSTSMSFPSYEALRDQGEVLTSTFAFADLYRLNVSAFGRADLTGGCIVSGGYFDGLGVRPAVGRLLAPHDDEPGAEAAAVLDHSFWQSRFGGDPDVVGQPVQINGTPFTVVGVAPAAFRGTLQVGSRPEVYVPMSRIAQVGGRADDITDGRSWWVQVIGRLAPGVDRARAQAVLATTFSRHFLDVYAPAGEEVEVPRLVLTDGGMGLDEVRSEMAGPLYLAWGVCGGILLIACANLASLLLARSDSRRRELAVRTSIGASRSRLVRQLLTESVLLSGLGGLLGLGLAFVGVDALFALLPWSPGETVVLEPSADLRVLGFSCGIALLTGVLFGLLPAWRASRVDPVTALRDLPESPRGGRLAFLSPGRALVVAQVALSLVLLVVAGLFSRTVWNLRSVDTGFDPHGVVLFRVDPTLNGYRGEELVALYGRIRERVEALPGVRSATLSPFSLLAGRGSWTDVAIDGETPEAGRRVAVHSVAPNFLETMRIPVIAGRDLAEADRSGPVHVVVNETFARELFPAGDALGRSFGLFGNDPDVEIVGIARNARNDSLRDDVLPTIYFHYEQSRRVRSMTYSVRTDGDAAATLGAVRAAVREIDPNLPLFEVQTLDAQIDQATQQERQFARLATLFGGVALALACIGLYGLLSHAVSRRTREFGIRQALGARRIDLVGLVLREMRLVAVGMVLGIGLSFLVTRSIASMLFGLSPDDPVSMAVAAAVLFAVATLAAYLPARRAARVDPQVALRFE